MTHAIRCLHAGNLGMDEADGMISRERLATGVAEANDRIGDAINGVSRRGDNADHATLMQYAGGLDALSPLQRPWRVIPGNHGELRTYEAAFPVSNRSQAEVIAMNRCSFLDVILSGAAGLDFRVTMHRGNRR